MAREVVFVGAAQLDLQWVRIYYAKYFPEGIGQASARLEKCWRRLAAFPKMGRVTGKLPRRRFSVPNVPFTIVYRENEDIVEVLRILDQRSQSYLDDLFEHS